MREVVCIFVQWDCLDRAVRDFLSTENTKQRHVALLLSGAARVLLLLWCTHRHWMSCAAFSGMQKRPGDLLAPHGSNMFQGQFLMALQRARTQGGPVATCSRISLNRVLGPGGRAVGCVLPSSFCPHGHAPGKWPDVRDAGNAAGHRLRARHCSPFLPLCHPNPSPRRGQWQNRADREEYKRVCCACDADLSVCSRKRNEWIFRSGW